MARIGLLNETTWLVYDGADDTLNCTKLDHDLWTYNQGIYLHGVANMYNYTSSLDSSDPRSADAPQWKARLTGLSEVGINGFFQDGIMFEICEATNNCNSDRKSFKTYLARWMAATTKLAPFTYDTLIAKIQSSATAAAQQCSGGVNSYGTGAGRQCGLRWTMNSTYDGDTGAGQQMAALEIMQGNLITLAADTVTNTTGGTSEGDPSAGTAGVTIGPDGLAPIVVTQADRVGAGFITFFAILFVLGACWWMMSPERLSDSPSQMVNKDRKKDWGWGDLSMGARMARRQFTQKGFADRDSMAMEKLNMGRGGSGIMASPRDSSLVYGGGHNLDGSSADVYSGIPFASGNVSHPGSGNPIYSTMGNGSGMLSGGSRPGSSRGPLQNGGTVPGHHVGQAA